MKIIETPFIHIPAAFGVALRNSVTTVIKALATFATGKSSMDFPGRFCVAGPVFYFSHYSSPLE
ncbi:hypothetical protein OCL02_000616 [Escherichia coli]|nr:hypothetical protein [Escherichia coli]